MDITLKSFLQDSVLNFRALARQYIEDAGGHHYWYDAKDYKGCFVNDTASMIVASVKYNDTKDALLCKSRQRILGAGCFSFVTVHPSNPSLVIKFFWKGASDKCLDYIKDVFAMQVKGENPEWMPKVYSIGKCLGVEYASMERLREFNELERSSYYNFAQDELQDIFASFMGYTAHDLHANNVMVRHDGTYVITDPCC